MKMLKMKKVGNLNLIIIVLVALGILAPIASNEFLPNIPDFVCHSALIVQAKKALFTGDFPIRVAPWQYNGYSYPAFQFYSPFPFTIAAIVYGVLFSFNVYLALKVMFFLIIVFSGIYTYRLGVLITQSKEIGILMAVSYIVSPYFLINILARSAFTEAFAQGVIPCCLFYSFKLLKQNTSVKTFLLLSLSWFMMLTSHLISFINLSLFMGLLVLGMWMLKLVSFKRIMLYGFSYVNAIFLSAWFIVPIVLFHTQLKIKQSVSSIIDSNWLTPLSELFSFQSVSMMPLPGNGLLNSEIYPSLGWISILSVIGVWYSVSNHHKKELIFDKKFAYLLLGLYLLALLLTWSPINFWHILPQFLQVSQFSYRFLTQSMWIGSLLFGLFLSLYFKEKNFFYVLIGVLFILNLSGSWIHTLVSRDLKPSSIAINPDIGYGGADYLLADEKTYVDFANIQLPLKSQDGWLIIDKSIDIDENFLKKNRNLELHIEGTNTLKNDVNLILTLNKQKKIIKTLEPGHFLENISIQNPNKKTSLILSTSDFFIPKEIDKNSTDARHLSIMIDSIHFVKAGPMYSVTNAEKIKQQCNLNKLKHVNECNVDISEKSPVVQLPLLYYPQLLSIEVDGISVRENYFSTPCGNLQCATFRTTPGKHLIQFKFSGLSWANQLSFFAWLFFVFFLLKKNDFNLFKNKIFLKKILKGFINATDKHKSWI